jgi:hypothetical protein
MVTATRPDMTAAVLQASDARYRNSLATKHGGLLLNSKLINNSKICKLQTAPAPSLATAKNI